MNLGSKPRILLVDDEPGVIDLYGEMLSNHLPSMPEVKTANNGSRALALLESEPFTLLITDLDMPKMDGLQVLSIARRKYPQMRLVVLTGIRDEQFRTRAYAMGIDQYWIKPESDHEMGLFMESIESLLQSESQGGFRGMQSKSLVDIIQLECLSRSTSILKISNGMAEGRIWIQSGEVVDSEAPGVTGEAAFLKIVGWKTGSFEILPGDPTRERTIFTSYQGLLLNTAQAIDEAASITEGSGEGGRSDADPGVSRSALLLTEASQMTGVEFLVIASEGKPQHCDYWGISNSQPVAQWTMTTLQTFDTLGDILQVGQLQQVLGIGPQRKVCMTSADTSALCVGFAPGLPINDLQETMNHILIKWVS